MHFGIFMKYITIFVDVFKNFETDNTKYNQLFIQYF